MLVEFIVASGRTERGRSWARIDPGGAVEARGEGAAPDPADVAAYGVGGLAAWLLWHQHRLAFAAARFRSSNRPPLDRTLP